MVGHQNELGYVQLDELSLGGQGMVGHQNRIAASAASQRSLGGQGMVGHQNYDVWVDPTAA